MEINPAVIIGLAVKTSIILTVLGLGLQASLHDATSLFRRPGLFLRSLTAMNVIVPLVAVALALAFDLHPAVKIALIAASVSPVPPILPKKQLKFGGSSEYAIGLLTMTAVLAIVIIPLSLLIIDRLFDASVGMTSGAIAALVFQTVLAPLAVGILIHEVAPAFALRIAKPVVIIATVLLGLGVLPVLFTAMPSIVSLIGNGTLVAIIVFVLVGLAAGHLLGGPESENRTVLALSTATRHPGVAIAIAHTNFPEVKLATAAILLYLLVSIVITKPYLTWWQKRHPLTAAVPPVNPRHA